MMKNKSVKKIKGQIKSELLDELIGINTADKLTIKEELRREFKSRFLKQNNIYWLWCKRLAIIYVLIMYVLSKYNSVQGMGEISTIEIIKLFVSM